MSFKFKFKSEEAKMLKAQGLDPIVFSGHKPFDVNESFQSYKPDVRGTKAGSIAARKQIDYFEKLMEKPLHGHKLTVINSYPSDTRAKLVAANIMYQACKEYLKKSPRQRAGKTMPVWHRIYGGYADSFRDKQKSKPSLLVISNVNIESTPQKLEKLRDLLEMYNTIPRIVVTGGIDPLTFFAAKMFYSVNMGLH